MLGGWQFLPSRTLSLTFFRPIRVHIEFKFKEFVLINGAFELLTVPGGAWAH